MFCKGIGIRKSEFETKNQFVCHKSTFFSSSELVLFCKGIRLISQSVHKRRRFLPIALHIKTNLETQLFRETIPLLSDRNKILNDEQRRQRNNPQIKIDNAENSKKMKCIMINNYYKGLRIL